MTDDYDTKPIIVLCCDLYLLWMDDNGNISSTHQHPYSSSSAFIHQKVPRDNKFSLFSIHRWLQSYHFRIISIYLSSYTMEWKPKIVVNWTQTKLVFPVCQTKRKIRKKKRLPRPKWDCNSRVPLPRLFRYGRRSLKWNYGVVFSLFHSMKFDVWVSLAVHPAL